MLLAYSRIVRDRCDDIMERIIKAFGIDYNEPTAEISFELFCKIKSFFDYYTLDDQQLTGLWLKILNPQTAPSLNVSEQQCLYERFCRGKIL